jgi:hypothetical protein
MLQDRVEGMDDRLDVVFEALGDIRRKKKKSIYREIL